MSEFLGRGTYGTVNRRGNEAIKNFVKMRHAVSEYAALQFCKKCPEIINSTSVNLAQQDIGMQLAITNLREWIYKAFENVSNSHPKWNNEECAKECKRIYKQQIKIFMKDILSACIYLHDRGCVHADIKLGNILITKGGRDAKYHAVLGDCGFVCPQAYAKTAFTSPAYRDPLMTNTWKHDIYSLGIVFLEILTFKRVRRELNYEQYRILSEDVDAEYRSLLRNMVSPHLKKRPSARNIYRHIFRTEYPELKDEADFFINKKIYNNSVYHNYWKKMNKCATMYYLNNKDGLEFSFAYFLSKDDTRMQKLAIYACAFLYIYRCVFGLNRRRKHFDLREICNIFAQQNKEEHVLNAITEILQEQEMIRLIFSHVDKK